MNRAEAKQFLPVISAFAEGKTIQVACGEKWNDAGSSLAFTGHPSTYRVKVDPLVIKVWVHKERRLAQPHSATHYENQWRENGWEVVELTVPE